MADEVTAQSQLGQWPHSLSFVLASLACTLGLFNISRFAILSIHFGANFIVQFLIMSLVMGIPLFTFHVSLGQLLAAGTMDMWKISPVFQGIGIALLMSQALIGIYSIVGVSWMFVYFRDSFITKQDLYGWAEPYDNALAALSHNMSLKLEETVSDYFSGTVLQRHHLEAPPHSPGRLKFQVTFNLAVVWMIVFICLSKGLRSYGKVVYLFSLLPVLGMLVLFSKLLGLIPSDSRLLLVFPPGNWSEFFVNTKSWTAAIVESFYTWGLLGASAMQIASHNRPKHFLHRDTTLVTIFTLVILMVAALFANVCSELLLANGFIYIPSSFERKSSYNFLHPIKKALPPSFKNTPVRWMHHTIFLMGEKVIRPGVSPKQQSGYQALRLATELVPATLAMIGAEKLSPFWSILFYFVLILFGIAQQLAIMHCVITGIIAIKVKTLKNWETTITFFTCACGFILGLPMTTELGIFVVYFLDHCVGGGWWIIVLYLAEIAAVFMVRGRPYSGETVVATLFNKASTFLHDWAAPLLSFTWNVILPVVLMVLCVTIFKNGNFRDLYKWYTPMSYDYWPSWSREIGSLLQLIPLITVPFVSLIQSCRYLSDGPPDIFDRMQLLTRPPLDTPSSVPEVTTNPDVETGSTAAPSLSTIEDPPPKYTPPPSYTTATGARIAKLLRQSFRRSVRRIQSALGNSETTSNTPDLLAPLPPPPDYAAVLVEINQANNNETRNESGAIAATSSNLTATDVAQILRNSFRRALRDSTNIGQSSSSQRLVEAAAPINQDLVIIEDNGVDNKNAESVT
ncbi:hypothetical protein AAG570_010874 [Ranatra chinensis]|uniref:Uncharacterized protein n=1 Tax=Ranatra chinensis TaxID=642074 RepID=A0ABD0YJ91_9HEMI